MSNRLSRVFEHFRKDRSSKEGPNSPSQSQPSSSTSSPITSRTATFSTNATISTVATSTQSGSARSSRRTSQELNDKPEVIVSDAKASRLVRDASGISAHAGDALPDAKLLAEAGVSLCSLAGYSRSKTMQLLQSMPEYGSTGSRIPANLNVEGMYRSIQQRRTESYLTFVDFEGVDPMTHRIKADEIMFKQFGDRPEEYAEDALKQELENWRYTWRDEITILEQHEQPTRAAELRTALEPYDFDLDAAIERVTKARDRRLRGSINLERFEQEAQERRAEIANNKSPRTKPGSVRGKPKIVPSGSGSNLSAKSSATEKSTHAAT